MKKYILIDIVPEGIKLIKKVNDSERVQVLTTKTKSQQLWSVASFAEGMEIIKSYNEAVSPKVINYPSHNPISSEVPLWDLTKLSPDDITNIKDLYSNGNYSAIMTIHNTKQLTSEYYCCASYMAHIDLNIKSLDDLGV